MKTFLDAMADAGLGGQHIPPDGKIHRFTAPDDRPGSNNCWAVNFGPAGAYGSWKLGITGTWHDKSERSKADDAALAKQIKAAQEQRKAERCRAQQEAQKQAQRLFSGASTAVDHPYPVAKQITPYKARQQGSILLVPMYYKRELWNCQRIYKDGSKRFLRGGRVKRCYLVIGRVEEHVYICEGYATACTLHQETGVGVIAAFNAGNLLPVAQSIRAACPDIAITIAADNDHATEGNPGLTKGREAAAAVGGELVYPVFDDEPFTGTDFNDYLNAGGLL